MGGTGNQMRLGRALTMGGLLALLLASCAIQSQVLDAETGQPIPGAVVLGVWTKTVGVGFTRGELVGVRGAEADTEGRFTLDRPFDAITAEESITVYKLGYVAWNNRRVFPTYKGREEARIPAQVLLEKFLPGMSHERHMDFVSYATLPWFSDYAIFWSGFRVAIAPEKRMRDAPPPSPPPRYLTAPVVLAPGQVHEVTVGDEIPGWGRVREITAADVVVEQRLTEEEQDRLRQAGKAVSEILEYRLPRADAGGHPQLPIERAPRPSQQIPLPSR